MVEFGVKESVVEALARERISCLVWVVSSVRGMARRMMANNPRRSRVFLFMTH